MGRIILEGNLFTYAKQYYDVEKNEMYLYVIWKDI